MFVSVESQLFHTTSRGHRSDIDARLAREGDARGNMALCLVPFYGVIFLKEKNVEIFNNGHYRYRFITKL